MGNDRAVSERARGLNLIVSDTPQLVAEKLADIRDDLNRANFVWIVADIFAAFEARGLAAGKAAGLEAGAKVAKSFWNHGPPSHVMADKIEEAIRALSPSSIETADERTRKIVAWLRLPNTNGDSPCWRFGIGQDSARQTADAIERGDFLPPSAAAGLKEGR